VVCIRVLKSKSEIIVMALVNVLVTYSLNHISIVKTVFGFLLSLETVNLISHQMKFEFISMG
jgi:hypothetical protein